MWFRRDLRLDDHAALAAAADLAGDAPVLGLFVDDEQAAAGSGPNRRRFVDRSVVALDGATGGRLWRRAGRPETVVPAVAAEVGAEHVVVTADAGPYGRRRDRRVAAHLERAGRRLVPVGSPYAAAPGTVRAGTGSPYRVFTPYLRTWRTVAAPPAAPASVRWLAVDPSTPPPEGDVPTGAAPAGNGPDPRPAWWPTVPDQPPVTLPVAGEPAATARLQAFVDDGLAGYAERRDRPDLDATTRLSPHLHVGSLHPSTVLQVLDGSPGGERLAAELAWRDFYADVLWHHPASAWAPLVPAGRFLRWDDGAEAHRRFAAWALGRTGYPLVDAGMRQLLAEGWMHNRVRMVTASFLVKDLHLDWRWGARWFLWHLVDGDLASNNHGWQWVAGTGTDAAPFHRVFNPERQRQRFDPDGAYVARWVPEADGFGYPSPVVDHDAERREALARWDEARHRAGDR